MDNDILDGDFLLPSVKDRYFLSVSEALQKTPNEFRWLGKIIYVYENDRINEYWFRTGISDNDLILKTVSEVDYSQFVKFVNNIAPTSGNVNINKNNIGLGNVDNTSDLNKPISNATQNALDDKQDTLISNQNIKTLNGFDILGSGDLQLGTGTGYSGIVSNYSALPSAVTASGKFYYVLNSQGTKWLPGALGGTYYPEGTYYSDGTQWYENSSPMQATLSDVDAGIIIDQFVSPATFSNAAKWGNYVLKNSEWKKNGTNIYYNDGNVGIGTDTPDQALTLVRDNQTSTFINTVYETTQNFFPPAFIGRKARGTLASPTAVQAGDFLFQLGGRGYDGTNFPTSSSGAIIIGADDTFSTTSRPTYLSVELTPSGSTIRSEVVKFTNDGMRFAPTGSVNLNHIGATSRLNFGMMSGSASSSSEVNGAYFSVFGNNWVDVTQRGSAEFVFDTRNSDSRSVGFGVTSFDGTTWTRFFRVASPSGRIISSPDSSKLTFNSGIFPAFSLSPSITTSGTAGYRGFYLSVFEQSVAGSGSSILADFGLNAQAGGSGIHTSRFIILSNGNIGLGTTAPTHTLTLPSTSTGVAVYNTTDQTTNFERGLIRWTSNVFEIATDRGGTQPTRVIRLNNNGRSFSITNGGSNVTGEYNFASGLGVAGTEVGINGILTTTSGTQNALAILNSINQSGTAGYRGLWISPYEQTIGSGAKLLIDAGINTAASGGGTHTSRFVITSDGNVGIGTTTPLASNQVRRALVLTDTTNNTTIRQEGAGSVIAEWFTSGAASAIGTRSSHNFTIIANNADRVTIDTAGNVGIGTTSPAALTHIFGSASTPLIIERNTTANTVMQYKNPGFNIWTGMDGAGNFGVSRTSADLGNFADMLRIDRASGKLNLRTGSNTSIGTGTLVAGTVTISNTAVTANSVIFLTNISVNASTAIGTLTQGTITAGTSFVVNSRKQNNAQTLETADVSTFMYLIIN